MVDGSGTKQRSDIRRAFDHLKSVPLVGDTIENLVASVRDLTDRYGDVEPRSPLSGVVVRSVDAGGIPAEWLIPRNASSDRRIVYLHGGGWIAGSLHSHRPMAATLAKAAGMPVLLVDYRLAPENPYPAGLVDCLEAYQWASRNGPQGPATAKHLFVGGDSCGGNLSAVLVHRLLEQTLRVPDRVLLISPVLDATPNPDRPDREEDPIASTAGFEMINDLYTKGAVDPSHPTVSPLNLPEQSLSRFPPTMIQVSGAEFLLWDAQRFAYQLGMAGARVVLSVWPQMPHVWHLFDSFLPEARQAASEAGRFVSETPD